jgi:hypothetical protein
LKTTNYYNTFIELAEDCPTSESQIPPIKEGNFTIANIQFDLISKNPYKYTSDEILFQVYVQKHNISESDLIQKKRNSSRRDNPVSGPLH